MFVFGRYWYRLCCSLKKLAFCLSTTFAFLLVSPEILDIVHSVVDSLVIIIMQLISSLVKGHIIFSNSLQ